MATNDKKILDVSQPGKSVPDATGKPVIVGHGTMIKEDPMVSGTKPAEITPEADKELLTMKAEKVIDVPTTESDSKKAQTPKNDKAVEVPDPEQPVDTSDTPSSNEQIEPTSSLTSTNEQAEVDAVAEAADKNKKKENKQSDEEAARAAAIQKLIDDKKYFVSVSATRRQRKAMHSLILLLVLVILMAMALYALVDAEIVDVGIQVPYEFIK